MTGLAGDNFGLQLTKHARQRMNHRGVKSRSYRLLIHWADSEAQLQGGKRSLSCTRECLREMRAEGVSAGEIDRVRRLAGVIANSNVVTVVQTYGRKGRQYRTAN